MKIFALLLRYWSYLFAGLFGLFLTGVAAVLLISGSPNFRLNQLPFLQGPAALYVILAIGLLGIAGALLGWRKGVRAILLVWTLVVFCLMVYGYFISPRYYFAMGATEAINVTWLSLGALAAFIGSIMQYRGAKRA